jgi:hypothetical protein
MYASHAAYSELSVTNRPEVSRALGSGGLGRSDVDLGGSVKETVMEGLLPWFRIRRDKTYKPGKQYVSDAAFLK